MKRVVLFGLLMFPISLIAMHPKQRCDGDWPQLTLPEPRSQDPVCVRTLREMLGLQILKKCSIDFTRKTVLDVGCDSGDFTVAMADVAHFAPPANFVLGYDGCPEKIAQANEMYAEFQDVAFECVSAEAITVRSRCDILTSFFCLPGVEDKKKVFANFHTALAPGGNIICALSTGLEQNPLKDCISAFCQRAITKYPFLSEFSLSYLTNDYCIAPEDLKNMLVECGFESIQIKPFEVGFEIETKDAFSVLQRPLFMATPCAALVREHASQYDLDALFQEFVDAVWEQCLIFSDSWGVYTVATTIVTAQKPSLREEWS